jgi:hypothetical protein
MRNLNSQIDTMFNETIYHIEADNTRRIKKFTIRFTKVNQKYSPEHLESLLSSYEKAIREIPRQFLRIEKIARQKYLVVLEEDRRHELLKVMADHVEMLVEKMNREYRDIFKNQKRLEEFDRRIEEILKTSKETIENETRKFSENLLEKLSSSSKIKPDELARMFDLDESTLIDLKAIEPLQDIHEVFEGMKEKQDANVAFEGICRGIVICSKFGTQIQIDPSQIQTEAARRFKKRSIAAGTLALKDLIDAIYILTQQLKLPDEKRNRDIINKVCNRLNESLEGYDGKSKVLDSLKGFFQMLSIV